MLKWRIRCWSLSDRRVHAFCCSPHRVTLSHPRASIPLQKHQHLPRFQYRHGLLVRPLGSIRNRGSRAAACNPVTKCHTLADCELKFTQPSHALHSLALFPLLTLFALGVLLLHHIFTIGLWFGWKEGSIARRGSHEEHEKRLFTHSISTRAAPHALQATLVPLVHTFLTC